jgi:hypothetical protein
LTDTTTQTPTDIVPGSSKDPLRALTTTDGKKTVHTIGRDMVAKAVLGWNRGMRMGLGYAALGHDIDHVMGNVWQGPWPFSRAADSIIQRLRKAGWIEKGDTRGSWRLTSQGHLELNRLEKQSKT